MPILRTKPNSSTTKTNSSTNQQTPPLHNGPQVSAWAGKGAEAGQSGRGSGQRIGQGGGDQEVIRRECATWALESSMPAISSNVRVVSREILSLFCPTLPPAPPSCLLSSHSPVRQHRAPESATHLCVPAREWRGMWPCAHANAHAQPLLASGACLCTCLRVNTHRERHTDTQTHTRTRMHGHGLTDRPMPVTA